MAAPMTYHATSFKEGGEGGIRHYFPYLASIPSKTKKSRIHSASILSLSSTCCFLFHSPSFLPLFFCIIHNRQLPSLSQQSAVAFYLTSGCSFSQPCAAATGKPPAEARGRQLGPSVRVSALRANFTCIIFLFDSDFQPPSECLPALC